MRGVFLDADSFGHDIDLTPITSLLDEWQVYPSTSNEDISARISGADIVLVNKVVLTEDHISRADNLKFVSVTATGTNNVDIAAAARRNIPVSNAVGYGTPSVVQHTLTLILTLSTNLHRYMADVAAGQWQQSDTFCLLDHPIQQVAGRTLGIVGYGELGSAVASAASALGMEILISDHPGKAPRPDRVRFEDVLAAADYVSLHCPLTPDNQHMINQSTLQLMRPTAFLINTARGALIDGTALIDALTNGTIAGAALDVLPVEPPPDDDPLLQAAMSQKMHNLILSPHNAWGTIESRSGLINQTRQNIEAYLDGEMVRVINGVV